MTGVTIFLLIEGLPFEEALVFHHSDIGWVLADNAGAAGNVPFSAYQDDRPAPLIVTALNSPAHAAGRPGPFTAHLGGDGWWWALTWPYRATRLDTGAPLAE